MSALRREADNLAGLQHVRFGPLTEGECFSSKTSSARARRDGGMSRPSDFRRLEIDGKLEFGGLLDRKVGRFGALENSIDKMGGAREQGEEVRTVRDQST